MKQVQGWEALSPSPHAVRLSVSQQAGVVASAVLLPRAQGWVRPSPFVLAHGPYCRQVVLSWVRAWNHPGCGTGWLPVFTGVLSTTPACVIRGVATVSPRRSQAERAAFKLWCGFCRHWEACPVRLVLHASPERQVIPRCAVDVSSVCLLRTPVVQESDPPGGRQGSACSLFRCRDTVPTEEDTGQPVTTGVPHVVG